MRGKKGRNYISRQACFVNRFTLQGFNIYIYIQHTYTHTLWFLYLKVFQLYVFKDDVTFSIDHIAHSKLYGMIRFLFLFLPPFWFSPLS